MSRLFLVDRKTTFSRLMIALALAAFGLRLYHLDYQSLWRDEVDAIRFSSEPFLNFDSWQSIWGVLTQPGHNGPLYFLTLQGWRALAGDSVFALRYFSLIAGVLMAPLIYQAARRLKLGHLAALIAATLAATSPYLLWYSQEAKMYTWLASLILLAIYAFQSALTAQRSGLWWALFVLATSLSFYVHILAPLMTPVYGLWGLIQWPRLKDHWRGWLISLGFLTLPYLPLLLWQAPLWLNDFSSGHPFYPLREQASLLLHLYSAGILRAVFSPYAISLNIFLLLAGFFGFPPLRRLVRPRLQVAAWLMIPPLLVYLISLRVTIFEDRYLIYILPAYYLLTALGLLVIARQRPRLTTWLAGLLLLLLLGFNFWAGWLQTSQSIKADFRAAAQYIAAHNALPPLADGSATPNPAPLSAGNWPFTLYLPLVSYTSPPVIMFQMPYLQYTFAYYFTTPYQSMEGLWTNDNRDPADVARSMTALTAGVDTLWLVVSEEDYWDSRHLTRQWLDEHGRRADEAHFVGVSVYRYILR